MKLPRLRLLIPVAVLLTILAPALRGLPGGWWLPDPWLLLFLWMIPDPTGLSLGRPLFMIGVLGVLRASVSAVSPFATWAGLGMALGLRIRLQRLLVEARFSARFLVGAAAALPLVLFDQRQAQLMEEDLSWIPGTVQVIIVGMLWAVAQRPTAWPGRRSRSGEDR